MSFNITLASPWWLPILAKLNRLGGICLKKPLQFELRELLDDVPLVRPFPSFSHTSIFISSLVPKFNCDVHNMVLFQIFYGVGYVSDVKSPGG